jgi:hypothetical protein
MMADFFNLRSILDHLQTKPEQLRYFCSIDDVLNSKHAYTTCARFPQIVDGVQPMTLHKDRTQ